LPFWIKANREWEHPGPGRELFLPEIFQKELPPTTNFGGGEPISTLFSIRNFWKKRGKTTVIGFVEDWSFFLMAEVQAGTGLTDGKKKVLIFKLMAPLDAPLTSI
jgi:hypothetical protein